MSQEIRSRCPGWLSRIYLILPVLLGRDVRLHDLRQSTDKVQCQDPRDRIYAVLALLSPQEKLLITPNYDLPAPKVYQDTMTRYTNRFASLDLLPQCDITTLGAMSMPTWVPNWAERTQHLTPFRFQQASGPFCAVWDFRPADVLRLAGVEFDTIETVFEAGIMEDMSSAEVADKLHALLRALQGNAEADECYPGGGSMLEAYACILTSGYFREAVIPQAERLLSLGEMRSVISELTLEGASALDRIHRDSQVAIRIICEMVIGRQVFRTSRGYVGLCSNAAVARDSVCIILGCPDPLIFRSHNGSQYQVVGASYVHGLESGEAFLGPLPGKMRQAIVYNHTGSSANFVFIDADTGSWSYGDPRIRSLIDCGLVDCEQYDSVVRQGRYVLEVTAEALRALGVNATHFDLV